MKGFNYPLTPKGQSTLNPRPPWYYSADFLNIEFWAEPSAVAALLPAGLDPDLSAKGHCNALFYDWQFSGDNEEYLDPARYQYREFFILVDALYAGKPVAYCPYIFVDKPAIHELVENVPHSVKIEQAWRGEGSLTLPVCRGEEISDLAPVRCGKGIRASMAYVVDDLRTLKDLRK